LTATDDTEKRLATKVHEETRGRGERKKIRKRMVPMGNTLMKRGTMHDRESKVFARFRGDFYKKSPWPPEAPIKKQWIIQT
jgi:hypothetical protein